MSEHFEKITNAKTSGVNLFLNQFRDKTFVVELKKWEGHKTCILAIYNNRNRKKNDVILKPEELRKVAILLGEVCDEMEQSE
jgi:hypothetical protein